MCYESSSLECGQDNWIDKCGPDNWIDTGSSYPVRVPSCFHSTMEKCASTVSFSVALGLFQSCNRSLLLVHWVSFTSALGLFYSCKRVLFACALVLFYSCNFTSALVLFYSCSCLFCVIDARGGPSAVHP
jgi:hypothetical protein